MASHKFGIMNLSPELNERYDYYEPEKYDCISINDDYIEPLLEKLACIECYWHTLERPEIGLAYCGINLIPPSSMEQFIECFDMSMMEVLQTGIIFTRQLLLRMRNLLQPLLMDLLMIYLMNNNNYNKKQMNHKKFTSMYKK